MSTKNFRKQKFISTKLYQAIEDLAGVRLQYQNMVMGEYCLRGVSSCSTLTIRTGDSLTRIDPFTDYYIASQYIEAASAHIKTTEAALVQAKLETMAANSQILPSQAYPPPSAECSSDDAIWTIIQGVSVAVVLTAVASCITGLIIHVILNHCYT